MVDVPGIATKKLKLITYFHASNVILIRYLNVEFLQCKSMFRIVKLINDFDWNAFVLCDKNVIYIYLLFDALWNIKII